MTVTPDLTIRRSTQSDRRSLERLAALDSRALTEGPHLVAEAGGELVAALPLGGGAAIADPFTQTARAVELLQVRTAEEPARAGGRGLLRRAVRLRPRAAAQA
jgi:hypothetical protein